MTTIEKGLYGLVIAFGLVMGGAITYVKLHTVETGYSNSCDLNYAIDHRYSCVKPIDPIIGQ